MGGNVFMYIFEDIFKFELKESKDLKRNIVKIPKDLIEFTKMTCNWRYTKDIIDIRSLLIPLNKSAE